MTARYLLSAASIAALAIATPAFAQDAAADQDSPIGEIVVTAQKYKQDAQDVPISISALDSDTLEKSGVASLDAVQKYAPGLQMATVGSGFVSYTYLRGSGTNQIDSGSDPSVAFFVDEVYVTGTAGAQFNLFDVDRVEVLKGPQGTLFGRNAAAGAISITTRRPTATFSADASVDVGNYDLRVARGAISGPLTADDALRFRVSGVIQDRSAFTENLAGDDPGTVKSAGGRAQLEYVKGDLSWLLTGNYYRARNGMTNQFLATTVKAAFLSPAAIAALPAGEDFYTHYYNVDGFEDQDAAGLTSRIELKTPIGTLTSVSAYRFNKFNRAQDQDGTIAQAYELDSFERDRSISQELRLSDQSASFNWVAGAYYYHDKTDRQDTVITGPDYAPVASRNLTSIDRSHLTVESIAFFGQASYFFTPQLSLTAGGRWTQDKKSDDRFVQRFTTPAYSVSPEATWRSFDPAATLSWQPSTRVMAYASYRQGFKSGGFQTLLPASATLAATPFAPETVRSYELGLKSEWFDRHLRANFALFRSDVTDQQILRVLGNSTNVIDNAGQTRTTGLDTIFNVALGKLRIDAATTYQHARFRQYITGVTSYAGKAQLRSPDFAGSYSAEYPIAVDDDHALTLRAEYTYQSKSFFDAANTETAGLYQPGYGLLNGRISFGSERQGWDVSLWAKNITGEHYFRNITVSGTTGLAVPGDPATYGISLHWGM
ncbi:TonB-dependent receptor [Sphingomonas sp.]|uniref:TonB-dependent receptor n=1 Tax=Sphingomonas sp. TaxID=28214 RepID=UPI001B1E48AE|nr:TonB-dependent receptor [Sphingomonas sp.]MBO9711764.1 TonB-dependent receptor [Sphingomonas sp.]